MQDIIDTVGGSVGDVTAVISSTNDSYLGITVANSTGPIPEVGLNIIGQTELATAPENEDLLIIHDEGDPKNKKISVQNLLSAVPPGVYEVGTGVDSVQLVAGTNTADAIESTISGGGGNCVSATAKGSVVGGGRGNVHGATSEYGTIGGGCGNYMDGAGKDSYNVIGGGANHFICGQMISNTIGGGYRNMQEDGNVTGKSGGWTIAGGMENEIDIPAGSASSGIIAATIGGGTSNKIAEDMLGGAMESATLAGGAKNTICGSMLAPVISGGSDNIITAADFGVISGGAQNVIATGAAFSSIAGGQVNTTGASTNVHILGSNITANQNDTTFVQGLTFSPLTGIPVAADNAAALALPLVVGSLYRSGADPDVVSIVH
jgi:hypothetical protein